MITQIHSPLRRLSAKPLAALLAIALAGCALAPRSTVQTKPSVQAPAATPQRNLTGFAEGLRCMDDTLFRFGVRDVSLMIEELQDNTRKLGAGTRDMMISAISDMTRRSRGVRLVTFGQDNQNIVTLINLAQRTSQFKVVPQYDIRGSITQFDEDTSKIQAGIAASLLQPVLNMIGLRLAASRNASVLGFDASVIQTADLSLLPGVTSKNTVVILREETGAGDGVAQIRNGSLSFSLLVSRNEGVAQSLRNIVELASIELIGKLVRVPYWRCLNLPDDHPEIAREIDDWYFAKQGSAELTQFLQEQLRNRKFYNGAADGKSNPAYEEALRAYRSGLKLASNTPGSEIDLATYRAFLTQPVPPAPPKPFGLTPAELAAQATASANSSTRAPGDNTAPPPPRDFALGVLPGKPVYRRGENVEFTVTATQARFVYCFMQSPSNGKIQRVFPNRFQRDPRIEANQPMSLPGASGFKIAAGSEGGERQILGCFATEREIYNDLPSSLRWGDFEDIRLGSFAEIQAAFSKIAGTEVPFVGNVINLTNP